MSRRLKTIFLFLGDIAALYAALFLTLAIRYGGGFYAEFLKNHLFPFTIIFVFWILAFYVAGLYDLRHLRNNLDFLKMLGAALAANFALAVFFFYLIPAMGIAPKRNLFVFLGIFAVLEIFWRRFFNSASVSGEAPNRTLIIAQNAANPISEVLLKDPAWLRRMGYEIVAQFSESEIASAPEKLQRIVGEKKINFIAVPRRLRNNEKLARVLYRLLNDGVEISDLTAFYEEITRKVPLEGVEEGWFIENLTNRQKFYDPLKRGCEFTAALFLGLLLLPLELIIAILVKLTSDGPIIYRQTRIGQYGKKFTLYKFRTMKMHDDHAWPEESDKRITGVGKLLRKTHLDELPQLWNIVMGDISVVGPRPDFAEFYEKLEKEISYYSVRTIVKPGLTGWAQIHQPPPRSVEETKERLCYDLYYIKNRSLILDLAIILKTIKVLLTVKGA